MAILVVLTMLLVPVNSAEATRKEKICIDGYFDDWEQVPKTKVTYKSWNATEYHDLALVIDGDDLCFYAGMADSYWGQVPIDGYTLTINNMKKTFIIRRTLIGGLIDYVFLPLFLPDGRYHNGFGVFDQDGGFLSLGEVGMRISNHHPNDQLEFRIKLETIEKLFHLEKGTLKNGVKMELNNKNIGEEKAVIVGTSSGPVMGVVLCVSLSGAALFLNEKRKRRVR